MTQNLSYASQNEIETEYEKWGTHVIHVSEDLFELNYIYFTPNPDCKIVVKQTVQQFELIRELKDFHFSQKYKWFRTDEGLMFRFYDEPCFIQPSSMKDSKGTPIMVILYEDLDFYHDYPLIVDVRVNDRNWKDYSIQVRADFVDIYSSYDLVNIFDCDYGNTESLYKFCPFDEYEKINKTPLFLQNVLSQRDASNYLLVHENKQITDDISNNILSFF